MDFEKALELLIPPPLVPYEAPQDDGWNNIERKLNTTLPRDYKQFIERYGSGRIDEFLSILNPFSSNKHRDLLWQMEMQLGTLRELKEGGTEIVPFEFFPSPGGLLPFGLTDNGDVLYWLTVGQPDNWSVAVNAGRSPEWDTYQVGMVEFLWKILGRQDSCKIFPSDFPGGSLSFVPSVKPK